MKTRFALLVTPFLLLFALACSDNPTAGKLAVPRGSSTQVTPTGTLDQEIIAILTLLPKGLETAATTRWSNLKAKYALGVSDPAQMAVARQMLFDLSAWVTMKGPNMDPPPNNESKAAAAARAVLYMAMYVYHTPAGEPFPPPPPYFTGADAVVGLVTPGAAATVVTPLGHAGVALEAGSVAENTIVVISQNPTPYLGTCSGPLNTTLCQWPQFYRFDEFPHTTLLKVAKFSVCHVNSGDLRNPPLGIHEHFRLAHTKPASEADYTPGSTVQEGIEILPYTSQTFIPNCGVNPYLPDVPVGQIGAIDALKGLARRMVAFVTPKTAYAIDQGGGGLSLSFSDFNDVDPITDLGTLPGDDESIGFGINDAGHVVGLSLSTSSTRPFIWINGAMTSLGSLGGTYGEADAINNSDVVVGNSKLVTGEYHAFRWTTDGGMTDLGTLEGTDWSFAVGINSTGLIAGWSTIGQTTNHNRSWISQNGVMTELGTLPGGTFAVATGINDAGQVTGWGDSNLGTRAWIWQNGTMTMSGTLGGATSAYAINAIGSVVGGSYTTTNTLHAFLWSDGITDITVPGDGYSIAEGISSDGRIVGLNFGTSYRAVLWQDGRMIDLGTLGGNFGEAKGVNGFGKIVGQSTKADGKRRATVWVASPRL